MSSLQYAEELIAGGAELIQYRWKGTPGDTVVREAEALRRRFGDAPVQWIMNDRADWCMAAGFTGVHLGQDDMSVTGARALCKPSLLVGKSTHNPTQVNEAELEAVDYIAIGPVFPTQSKTNPDPSVGLEGVRMARKLTRKPLVAIGGITRANCRDVVAAGADSVAVISDLMADPQRAALEFKQLLG